MNEETKNALIKGGIRTMLEIVPGVGGAISNAWNEYEAHKQNQRIEEFFKGFGEQLKILEEKYGSLEDRVGQLPDAPELLEIVVDQVKREPAEGKRRGYVSMLGSFISAPEATSQDERQSLIDSFEILTGQDLGFLAQFMQGSPLRGDMITRTEGAGWATTGDDPELIKRYERQLGPAIHSLAKLEGRGLITPDNMNAMFSSTGNSSAWYNKFRQRVWRITPMGEKLMLALRR